MHVEKQQGVIAAILIGLRSMMQYPGVAAIFVVASILQGLLQGAIVLSLQYVLLSFEGTEQVVFASLLSGAALIFGVWSMRALMFFVAQVFSARLAHKVEVDSMHQVLSKLLMLPVHFFDKSSQGDLVMSAYFDLKGVRIVTMQVGAMFLHITRMLGLVISAFIISPKLALIGLVVVPLGALPTYWIGQRIVKSARQERDAIQTLYDSFLQITAGIRVIKVNSSEDRLLERARGIGQDLYAHLVRQVFNKGLSRFLLETIVGTGLIIVLLIGGYDIVYSGLTWPSLLSILIAVMALYGPIISLIQMYGSISSVIPNLYRVNKIIEMPVANKDKPDSRPLLEPPATIELRNVSFGYEERPILESISATFHRGETIGIVGPSGAGKSTLLSLLLRFYEPTEGTILFDGVDLRDIKHADLMRMSAIVMQDPFLFVDTVANNISIGCLDGAPMEDIIAAAKDANIHDEILQMRKGYETILGRGPDASGVSGGQRQRICIAAALLKNAPLLFLDEATSSLDSVSERQVQRAIERLMHGRTTFVIAHRLSTLRNADRIMVLQDGKLVGLAPHEELLKTCPVYQRLWSYQQSHDGGTGNQAAYDSLEENTPEVDIAFEEVRTFQ
jgi:subfamily B ATP-binding cassette protein MsbA